MDCDFTADDPCPTSSFSQPSSTVGDGGTEQTIFASETEMQQILPAVRIRPFLYDPSNALYGDVEWQSTAWREISEQLGIPDAKVRWFRLRDALKNAATAPQDCFWRDSGIDWLRPYFTASRATVNDIYIPPSDPAPAKRPRVEQPPTTPANGAQAEKKWEVCDETMKRLFGTVKNYPALYDPKNSDFGNEEEYAELWRVIALELDLPDAQKRWENIFVRNCTHGRDRMLLKKQYRDELRWLEPNVQAVGRAVFQRKGTKVIDAVRKLPELYDPADPRYNDETHVKALWQQLTDTMDVGDAKTQWSHWLRSMAEGKNASDGFWYAKEMEWVRPFLKHPLPKRPQAVKESNEDVTKRMIDSMAKMLRQLTMDKRVQAYERFREVVAEVNGEGTEEKGTEK